MGEIASQGQLRASFWRWAAVTVPAIVLLGFLAGSMVPSGSDNAWYVALEKPALTPPGWLFPVAWSLLYVCQGLALAMVLNARGAPGRGAAVAAFAAQFALNLSWTFVFFGAHRVMAAFWVIAAMLALAIVTTVLFGRIRTAAAWLMLPYLVWISFAGVLTLSIHNLNPAADTLAPGGATTKIQL